MITVHHLENSRSQRVLWMLEELGLDYEIQRYERDPQTSLAPAALKAVHPLGKSPVIVDDGRVIAAQVRSGYLGPNIEANLAHMEAELGRSLWFAGDELSGADVQMSFPVEAALLRAPSANGLPRLRAFVQRVQERPAYQKALARGGPYSLLGS
jgi:glutathione S-transferase